MDPGGNEINKQGTSSTPPQGETTIESDPKMLEKNCGCWRIEEYLLKY